jgi:hypothetical protein
MELDFEAVNEDAPADATPVEDPSETTANDAVDEPTEEIPT